MLNKWLGMGRLVRDPSMKQTQNGTNVTTFTIACERDFQQGEEKQTDFISCVAWRQTAEFVNSYFHKGNLILVQGSLQSRKWQDKDGKNRTEWEVIADRCYFTGEKNGSAKSGAQDAQTFTEDPAEDDGDVPF